MICKDKEVIRKEILCKRLQVEISEKSVKDKVINEKLYTLCKEYKNIYLYSAIKNEVDLSKLMKKLIAGGKKIFLPSIIEENITFRRYYNGKELSSGRYGILEADGEISFPDASTIIIVPAVAFDLRCNRIGYGAGYYDRYLATHRNVATIGTCYNFQLVDEFECDISDIPVDTVITEKNEVRRKK